MVKFQKTALLVSTLLFSSCEFADDQARVTGADRVLTGGRIYTVDDRNPWAEAVAIRDNQFVYVGNDEGVEPYIDDSTVRVDLAGRFVIPGLIDGHTHPGYIDLERYGPELYVSGREGPHKRDLDAIVPDRPVWITSTAWHSYWLNSKGLEALGVDENTPDPRPGIAVYGRDEKGELTGWVKEGAGWQHFADQFPVDPEPHKKSVEAFLDTLSEHGVTTVYDGGAMGYEDHVYGFLAELDRSGKLPLRYEGTYQIFLPERRNLAIGEMKRLRSAYGGERLRFRTIKLFMDGILENRTGSMLDAYADDPSFVGATMLSSDELRDFLLELHEEKFDLHVHTIGDLAVRTVLDAVEAARVAVDGDLYPRVTLSHVQVIDPADLGRFRELGVSANFTPWWHGVDVNDSAKPALGEDRHSRTYTAKPLFDLGANVTFSSDDWNLPVLSPFLGMQVAHNRQYPKEWLAEEGGDVSAFRLPEAEKLDLELLIRGYTINGAYPFRRSRGAR